MNKDEIWQNFLDIIRPKLSTVSYCTWFVVSKLYDITNDKVTISVPYEAHIIQLKKYNDIIQDIFTEMIGKNLKIEYLIESDIRKNNLEIHKDIEKDDSDIELYKYYGNFNSKYTFDTFVVGDSNRFAYSSAMSVATKPGRLYNPLFIYGKSGLGKTHLMHAIGNYINNNSDKKVLYITTEQFVNDFVNINKKNFKDDENIDYVDMFKRKYRNVDVLMIDDIQFLGSATKSQQEFTNTFNSLYDNEKQIIISSDRSINDLQLLEERLKTRFNWGLIADINPPDYDLKVKIINQKIKSEDLFLKLSEEIINFVASNCGSDIRNLEGSITRLIAYKAIMNIPNLSLEDTMIALKDYTNNLIYSDNTISKIQKVVSNYFNLSVDDLKGKRRNKIIALARQIAMYLSRILTEESYPRIGLEFGGRDHATAIHSFEKINKEIKNDKILEKQILEIKKLLNC